MNYLKYFLYSFVFIMSYSYCGEPPQSGVPQIYVVNSSSGSSFETDVVTVQVTPIEKSPRKDLTTSLVNTRREYFNGLHKTAAQPAAVVIRRDSATIDEELCLARQIEKAKGRNRLGSALKAAAILKVSSNEEVQNIPEDS